MIDVALLVALAALCIESNVRRVRSRRRWVSSAGSDLSVRPPRLSFSLSATIRSLLLLLALVLAWGFLGRPAAALGLALSLPATAIGLIAVVALLALEFWLLVVGIPALLADAGEREWLASQIRRVRVDQFQTPSHPAFTAALGAWEELVFRGYLLWLCSQWIDPLAAAVVTSLAFGAMHLSQGLRVAFISMRIGGICAALTLATGSVFPAILLHAGHNANVSLTIRRAEALLDAAA